MPTSEHVNRASVDIEDLQTRIAAFARARDWDRWHSPKNLAMALGGETGEMMAVLQWLTEDESRALRTRPDDWAAFLEEFADVMIYLLRLADVLDVDIRQAVLAKLARNEARYPVHLSKGNNVKYSRREQAVVRPSGQEAVVERDAVAERGEAIEKARKVD